MKTFEQLTDDQKQNAIEFAKQTIIDCLELGIYTVNREPNEQEIQELAEIAAEEGRYNENGQAAIGHNVPPFFVGGCV